MVVVRATTVGSVHAASASGLSWVLVLVDWSWGICGCKWETYLDARAVGQATAKLQKSSGDFVAKAGLALVVVLHDRATREEASAARSSGSGGGCGVMCGMVMRRAARKETSALGGSSDSGVVVLAVGEGHLG